MILFVGNLSYDVTAEVLRPAFEAHGEVVAATVATDPLSGQSRGYGFVKMNDADALRAARALRETTFEGRRLLIEVARSQS